MIRFSANLGFLWPDRPLLERVEAAGHAGFRAIELHWPYDVKASVLAAACTRAGVTLLGVNTVVGDASRGDFGLGALPGREDEFAAAVKQSVNYCAAAGGTAVHAMAGVAPYNAETQRTFVENLKGAADLAGQNDLEILIEPINGYDKPGYFLSSLEQAADIIAAADRSNVKIMFDVYHIEREQGEVLERLESYWPLVGHIQIAAVPDRGEPDAGALDYGFVLKTIEALGYRDWIGCEYRPRGDTNAGLVWMQQHR
jgi:hydroxypyruvate isomerase